MAILIENDNDISGYLAPKKEATPDANGNGPKTAKYFKDNFDMSPRESLALMGAHTIVDSAHLPLILIMLG